MSTHNLNINKQTYSSSTKTLTKYFTFSKTQKMNVAECGSMLSLRQIGSILSSLPSVFIATASALVPVCPYDVWVGGNCRAQHHQSDINTGWGLSDVQYCKNTALSLYAYLTLLVFHSWKWGRKMKWKWTCCTALKQHLAPVEINLTKIFLWCWEGTFVGAKHNVKEVARCSLIGQRESFHMIGWDVTVNSLCLRHA